MAKRAAYTPEQQAQRAQQLYDTLTAQVEALSDSVQWKRYLDFMGSFHAYSLTNVLLILGQYPEASRVAGFRQWQERGRQVRKGMKGIKIRGYWTKKVTRTNTETGQDEEAMLRRFPILTVFDISQTDPIEGVEQPENPARRLVGTHDHQIAARVLDWITGLGWTVATGDLPEGVNGTTSVDGSKIITISTALCEPAMIAKTLLHETAHALMHTIDGHGDRAGYVEHRDRMETEAESVAYVVAGLAGLDTSDYSVGYVTGWSGGDLDMVKDTAAAVLATVHQIASEVLVDHDNAAEVA